MGLVVHIVNLTAQARSIRLTPEDRDDLCAEVFLHIIRDDFAPLRRFRGESSLATYLTVIARRIAIRELHKRKTTARLDDVPPEAADQAVAESAPTEEQRISDRDEVERLLEGLDGNEARIVRLFHLDGKSYQEISAEVGVPENSIGPILSRAREKLRRKSVDSPA